MIKGMTCAVLVTAVLGTSAVASAAPPALRQANQSARISVGVANGELTRSETGRLLVQQAKISATKRLYKSDGHFGRYERARVNRMQNRASQNIWFKKHNRRSRR